MTKDEEIIRLKIRVAALEKHNQLLKEELSFLKTFPTLAQGLKGEVLVAKLTGGTVTGYAVRHDVEVKTGDRLEVKYSHVNVQNATKTGRWNWYNLLGRLDKGKEYDYLVLVGDKDPRYDPQYPIDLPYVFFLVPRSDVGNIKSPSKA